jgi:curved DNA-binding protein
MADRDYYDVLGVARDASADAIKKAYRAQARKYHPDVNPGDKKAEASFKEAQQAYDILSDPEKRVLYDNYGKAAFEGVSAGPRSGASEWTARQAGPGGGYDQSFDFSDFFGPGAAGAAGAAEGDVGGGGIFEELLGRMRGGRGRQRPTGPRPGRNVEANLTIPFLTAIRGGETKFDIEREDGKRETLAVKIPPGTESGAKLRLRGQGEPGEHGGPRGDLTLHVNVEPHPYFTRDGRNLSVEVPITVPEATLGAKIEVPTLDGRKALPIPAGTSSGQKLRLRGQGVPASGNKPAGDLFLIPRIVVPKKVDEDSQRLITEFGERNPLNPREGIW